MRDPFHRLGLIAVTAMALALPASAQTPEKPATPAPADKAISVQFAGGSLLEYSRAVQKAAGGVNIIVAPAAEEVALGPAELRDVTVMTALNAAENLVKERLRYQVSSCTVGKEGGASPVYLVQVGNRSVTTDPRGESEDLRVFSIKGLTDPPAAGMKIEPMKAETILTAIDAALTISNPSQKPTIKYHADSGLILAKGKRMDLNMIDEVISHIRHEMDTRRDALREKDPSADVQTLIQQLKQAQDEIAKLKAELEKRKAN